MKYFLILITLLFIWSFFIEPNLLVIKNYTFKELGDKKIVFVSDFHIAKNERKRLQKIVNTINEIEPDLVLSGGDFIKGHDGKYTLPIEEQVKELKKIKDTPVIMLSARTEEYDKLIGFDIGVDDYVTKPFSPKELVARVKAVTKRHEKQNNCLEFGDLMIDDIAHEVKIKGDDIPLTPKEYDLLKYFVSNNHIALTREQLLTNIWGYDFYGDDRTVDTHVKTLRHRLGEYGKYIKTIRKVGYKFEY